ncbi:MAG TPA: hypothetical protein VIC51_05020 [Psychromonas sp.]
MVYKYKKMISDIRQDLAKYAEQYQHNSSKPANMLSVLIHSPAFYVVASYRILYWLKMSQERSGSHILKILFLGLRIITNAYSMLVVKIQITHWPEIGPGLYLSNKGGIIIGPKRIGANCVIHHNVTIGVNRTRDHPEIGDNFWIGHNSVICGQVIKDNVIVMPNTIVGKNIPEGVVIKGNPGKIVRKEIENSRFLSNSAYSLKDE